MAKKIKGGSVEFEVTDGGSLKKLEKNSKRAGEALGSVARNAQEADRRLKGTANMSSNSTKNFAKQAQTISGGLVPAYATLAAQVFAVSAAFEFLKSAFNTRNLIEGQKAFSAVTGVAYRALTKDIKAATQGMLSFEEAAQAAAIGTAAGLSRGQLTAIGKAATDVSLALGRDLTDSFNRLVRGITKAEPELLDELGIILRLDPATKNYAANIGKAANALTQFEKSQAIAVEVLDQAETKFGKIQEIMDPNAFALGKFSAAFNDLMVQFKVQVVEFLTPTIQFLSKNVEALVGALALGLAPILRTILPDFKSLGDQATKTANAAKAAAAAARADASLFGQRAAAAGGEGRKDLMKSSAQQAKTLGIGLKGKGDDAGMLSRRQLAIYKNQLENQVLLRKKYTEQEIRIFREFIITQEALLAQRYGEEEALRKKNEFSEKASRARMAAFLQGGIAVATKGVGIFARAASFLVSATGWVGLLMLLVSLGKEFWDSLNPPDEKTEKIKERIEEIKETTQDLIVETERFRRVQREGLLGGLSAMLQQRGQAAASVDIGKVLRTLNESITLKSPELVAKQVEAVRGLESVLGTTLIPQETLNAAMQDGVLIQEEQIKKSAALAAQYTAVGQAAKASAQLQQQVTNSIQAMTRNTVPFGGLLGNLIALQASDKLQLEGAPNAIATKMSDFRNAQGSQKLIREAKGRAETELKEAEAALADMLSRDTQTNLKTLRENVELAKSKVSGLTDALETANLNVKNLADDVKKSGEEFDELTKRSELTAARIKMINTLQGYAVATQKQRLALDRAANALPLNNQVGTKNARERLKLDNAALDVSEKSQAVAAAQFVIDQQTETTAEEIKISNQAALELAQAELETSISKLRVTNEEVNKQITLNNLAERRLKYEEDLVKTQNERQRLRNRDALAQGVTGTRGGLRNLQVNELSRLMTEVTDVETKLRLNRAEQAALNPADAKFADERRALMNEEVTLLGQIEEATQKVRIARQGLSSEPFFAQQGLAQQARQAQINVRRSQGMIGGTSLGAEYEEQALALLERMGKTDISELDQSDRENLKATVNAAVSARIELGMMQETSAAIESSFSGLFNALLDGTKSLKQALGDMMKQLLADLAKAYLKAALLKTISGMGFGLPQARYGGIMSPSGKSFAVGGIASGPTSGYMATLHGTEAVVPLGNDRSIPVELKGAGGGGNVVNVSVNVAADGQSSVNTQGDNMQGLGKVIGQAVQQELMRQKRPGGMLSPYGAA